MVMERKIRKKTIGQKEKGKVLLVATVGGFVPQFELKNVEILKSFGYEVHYASNFRNLVYETDTDIWKESGIIRHQIDFSRSPYSIDQNITAYQQLKKLLKQECFELVHCHTPMGGLLARLASQTAAFEGKVLYTAHGFHFYRGAPLRNWILYYVAERWMAHVTDALITINKEDYSHAKKFHLRKSGHLYYVPGVGIHLIEEQSNPDKESIIKKRQCFGISKEDYVLISVGELSKRKNHQIVIQAMSKLVKRYPHMKYLICGSGNQLRCLKDKIRKNHLEENVILLGYRNDIRDLLYLSDCFLFPSLQEGLPVALMEAMAAGLPVICSDIRGSTDLIEARKGGILVNKRDAGGYERAICYMAEHKREAKEYGDWNRNKIKGFSQQVVRSKMARIYQTILNLGETNE